MLTTTDASTGFTPEGMTMPSTKLLVCEGACNGQNRAFLDEEIDKERTRLTLIQAYGRVVPLDDPALLHALRTLRHTEHRQLSKDWWACTVCENLRRYGSEL